MNAQETLEPLRRELAALGWDVHLRDDARHPYVQIMRGQLPIEHVFLAWFDEPHYTWASTSRQHPLDDPAGAAGRITTDLEQHRSLALRG